MTREAAKNTEQLSALPGEVTKQDFVTLFVEFWYIFNAVV